MLLEGKKLAAEVKQRQAEAVKQLPVQPKLAIIDASDNPVIDAFVRVKQKYGKYIGVDVDLHKIDADDIENTLAKLNHDPSVHGIIVQLPLPEGVDTDTTLQLIDLKKDVDRLRDESKFSAPTPMAILWLLEDYNIKLTSQKIAVVGQGRLVGEPLAKMLEKAKFDVQIYDDRTKNLASELIKADVIVTATGVAGLITSDMVKPNGVVIDAGTSSEAGKLVGDVHPTLYERNDIKVSPTPGGVGPLTVCALFENVIQATV